jgi:small subunit ribosomal protein S6
MALQSLADAPNTLREYETIYILQPDTINDKVAEVNERVKSIIEERGGQILNVDNWGKRKLAYEIQKERKGIYLLWKYLGSPEIVAEFERNMRLLDPVMRYMTIKVDSNVATGSRETEVDGETYERAATTAADEEEIMTGRAAGEAAEGEKASATEGEAAAETTEAAAETTEAAAETTEAAAETTEAAAETTEAAAEEKN